MDWIEAVDPLLGAVITDLLIRYSHIFMLQMGRFFYGSLAPSMPATQLAPVESSMPLSRYSVCARWPSVYPFEAVMLRKAFKEAYLRETVLQISPSLGYLSTQTVATLAHKRRRPGESAAALAIHEVG